MKLGNYVRNIVLLCSVLTISACGAGRQIKPEVKQKINTIEVHIVFKYDSIYTKTHKSSTFIPFSQTAQLIADIADATSDAKKIEKSTLAIWPVMEGLNARNIPETTKSIYQTALSKVKWAKVKKLVVETGDYPEYYKVTKSSKYDAVMFIEFDYYLTENFKELVINSRLNMYQNMGSTNEPNKIFHMLDDSRNDLSEHAGWISDQHEMGKKLGKDQARLAYDIIVAGMTKQSDYLVKQLDPPNVAKKDEPSFSDRFWGTKTKSK
ncbi:MAG: hypothetical protein OEZ38_10965 [Gammaproteobacteria bacterium]|nr:hypothetical protein [Gammaproteobacteria bacterium]